MSPSVARLAFIRLYVVDCRDDIIATGVALIPVMTFISGVFWVPFYFK